MRYSPPERTLAVHLVALLLLAIARDGVAAPTDTSPIAADKGVAGPDGKTVWYDVALLGVEGRAFDDTEVYFDRLPARAHGVVRDAVWNLSRHSAGMCVRFVTDATHIDVRWTLRSNQLAMPHMPATGVSGVDLYVRDDEGTWRWLAVGQPKTFPTNEQQLVRELPPGRREYRLYLPLYNGVEEVQIGIPPGATLSRPPTYDADHAKPIVFYGTSITHGGCASRPGMAHVAILGRRFDRPTVNLGFSGNGRLETEVAQLMAEIDAAVFVIDCLPNVTADVVRAQAEPTVAVLRAAHPDTPILLVEDRTYANAFLVESQRERNETSRAALREVYERLKRAGDAHLYYLEGDRLLAPDGEGTVDGSHPTDLGFVQHADAFEAVLRPILGE
ncbi:MAG: SGNH/GDSL hydrolase family protein [Pirellulales bacterium]